MPVPVNLEVNMSILARYMQDVDQIVSNFVPYSNPYIILSWKVPKSFGAEYIQEIRSEVLWSGNLNYSTPTDTTFNDKFRIIVDTSFTIKGWLFPENKQNVGPIYVVDNNFVAVDLQNKIYSPLDRTEVVDNLTYQQQGYDALSSYNASSVPTNYSEQVTISAIPEFTNIFWAPSGDWQIEPIRTLTTILTSQDNFFTLYGKRFSYTNNFFLSANTADFFSNYQQITSIKSPTISGYKLDDPHFNVASDNIVSIYLPTSTLSASGKFTFVTANEAGWASSYQATSSILQVT